MRQFKKVYVKTIKEQDVATQFGRARELNANGPFGRFRADKASG